MFDIHMLTIQLSYRLGLELLTMHQIPEMPRPTSIPMPPSPNSESADSRERGESQQQGGSKPGSSGHFPMGTPDAEMRSRYVHNTTSTHHHPAVISESVLPI